jgi:hypothetical protein
MTAAISTYGAMRRPAHAVRPGQLADEAELLFGMRSIR